MTNSNKLVEVIHLAGLEVVSVDSRASRVSKINLDKVEDSSNLSATYLKNLRNFLVGHHKEVAEELHKPVKREEILLSIVKSISWMLFKELKKQFNLLGQMFVVLARDQRQNLALVKQLVGHAVEPVFRPFVKVLS